jgi:hypothetical protein
MTALVTGSKPFDAPCRRPGPGASHPIAVGTGPAVGQYSFIVYIPPILLASILFDRGSGFFATALSALLVALMVDWQADPVRHAAPLTLFVVVSLFVARLLVQQLGGTMTRESATPGCRITITIPSAVA